MTKVKTEQTEMPETELREEAKRHGRFVNGQLPEDLRPDQADGQSAEGGGPP